MRTFTLTLIACLLISSSFYCKAQDSFSTTGGDATGKGGTEAFSVGQIFNNELTGFGGSVSQGIEHAYEIFVTTVNENKTRVLFNVFPNPTADRLILQISDYTTGSHLFRLCNAQGQLLINGNINSTQTQLNTANLPVGLYFLYITKNNNPSAEGESFKIIKK